MKSFFKYSLATIVGLIIFSLLSFFALVGTISAIMSIGNQTTVLKPNAVYHLKLNGTITDRLSEKPMTFLPEEFGVNMGLEDILASIERAEAEEQIKGIFIEAINLSTSYATLQELRDALQRFKQSGKFVIAYSDGYSTGQYFLCSVADKIFLNPVGSIDWRGLSATTLFVKDLLDKVGVNMQIFKVGTYKSAVEPYTSMQMSEANRRQVMRFTDVIWSDIVEAVSDSRDITSNQLNYLANQGSLLFSADNSLTEGLVDSLLYRSDVEDVIATYMGMKRGEKPQFLTHNAMMSLPETSTNILQQNRVAIYYAEGNIVDQGIDGIVTSKMVKDITAIAQDTTIKAMVLRVNSPGGSAFGSEQIWYELQKVAQNKPLVVSMGDYAASGGYYISTAAHYIFAQPSTLTGSIGVFGMVPEASTLSKRIGVRLESVNTNSLG